MTDRHWQTQSDFIICPMLHVYAIAMRQIIKKVDVFLGTQCTYIETDTQTHRHTDTHTHMTGVRGAHPLPIGHHGGPRVLPLGNIEIFRFRI